MRFVTLLLHPKMGSEIIFNWRGQKSPEPSQPKTSWSLKTLPHSHLQDPTTEFFRKVGIGFVSGTIASIANIPMDVAKSRIQVRFCS